MRTPIIRLTIGNNVTLSGEFINHNEKIVPMLRNCASEYDARAFIENMRENGDEFQLVVIRNCADYKRNMATV